jgi:hypothetical protein
VVRPWARIVHPRIDELVRDGGGRTLDLGIGSEVVFTAGSPAHPDEMQPQGYLIARRV